MSRNVLLMVVVAVLAAVSGYFLAQVLSPEPASNGAALTVAGSSPQPSTEDLLGKKRPDFTLSDVSGKPVSASDFDGRIWLANFWATWCAPCVEEMPMLSRLQQEYGGDGVSIVGIALDDADRARDFAASLELSYPVLVGQTDVVLTGRRFGNATGMLPFSVLVGADGVIRWTHLGALDRAELERQIQSLR